MINIFNEKTMIEADVQGSWSIKDLMAHIATWDKRGINWITVASRGKIPEMPAQGYTWQDIDEFNQQTLVEHKDCSSSDVTINFHNSYAQLLEQV